MTARTPLELLDVDEIFSQKSLLRPQKFADECKRRGLALQDLRHGEDVLDALDQARALVPLFRVRNDLRPAFGAARRDDADALALEYFQHRAPSRPPYLQRLASLKRLFDRQREPYRRWDTYSRRISGHFMRSSEFLYSPYQLLLVKELKALPRASRNPDWPNSGRLRFKMNDKQRENLVELNLANRELAIVLSALEAMYLPGIIKRFTHLGGGGIDDIIQYQSAFDSGAMLKWLGWSVDRVRKTAEQLLVVAATIDPLGDWHKVIRAGRAAMWEKLRFDALVAHDHRVAAEMLMNFYDDLTRSSLAPHVQPRGFPWEHRLGTNDVDLDSLLTEFDLSPHPSVVIVLEGESELILFPRVMKLLGSPWRRDFIELVNAHGVDQPLSSLASYISAPGLGQQIEGGVLLTRPPTKFLVIADAEGAFKTQADRAERKENWVSRITEAIREKHATDVDLNDLRSLIDVRTWNDRGDPLEFANFTDEEIARALLQSYNGPSLPPPEKLPSIIANVRRIPGAPLRSMWKHWQPEPSKTRLAEALWPILRRKIRAKLRRRGTCQ